MNKSVRIQQQHMFKFGFGLELLFWNQKKSKNNLLINIFEETRTKTRFRLQS